MFKQGWSSAIRCNTGGLFYFILNISIPAVLLGNGRIQTPADSMEHAREGSSCISERQNDTARVLCFFSEGFCSVRFGSKGGPRALTLMEEDTLQW